MIYPLLLCGKVSNAPCLGGIHKIISEHQSSKYTRKFFCKGLGNKNTCNALYFYQVRGYDINSWHIIFSVDVNLPDLLWFLRVSQHLSCNFMNTYSDGTVLDLFQVIYQYFIYCFTEKSRKIGQQCYQYSHSVFNFSSSDV